MSRDVSSSGDPLRWLDAVRIHNPELTVREAADLAEKLDRGTKRIYAEGYQLFGMKPGEDGELDVRAILEIRRDNSGS